jgi:hypothetical protein
LFFHSLSTGILGTRAIIRRSAHLSLCARPVRWRRITMNKKDPISWKKLEQKCLSRRNLIRGAAGAALGTTLFHPKSAYASHEDDERGCRGPLLNPISGGGAPFAPFGVKVHHNPLNPATALANISDPSQVTDFDGFVGLTRIQGGGTGTATTTGVTTPLAYRADMGFAQGKFIGTDGHLHKGTFSFVWLDLYTGPAGSANLPQQIHDFNVHIDSNDVFWMVQVEHDAVDVDFDQGRARLRVSGLNVFDDHDLANSLTQGIGLPGDLGFTYPAIAPVATKRAIVSFDVIWDGIVDRAEIDNSAQTFKGSFLSTGATIKWSADEPGFHFESETPDPTRNMVSVFGRERNGFFFT